MTQKTPAEEFKAANEAVSEHCFKTGRLYYDIQLYKEALEKKEREYANLRVDFDRLRKEFTRAFEAVQKTGQNPEALLTEVPPPALEMGQ